MKKLIGFLLMAAGAVGGLYVGGWCLFIKPIIDVCMAIDAGTLTGMTVGIAILKCIFASPVGTSIFMLGYYLGLYIGMND